MNLIDQPIGQLARHIAGATRLFHAHQLDFCCGGRHSLRQAAEARGLDAAAIAEELAQLQSSEQPGEQDWGAASREDLIDHILVRFHQRHREQLPELIRLAGRVEQVHRKHPGCPAGLADHLSVMHQELDSHMRKEELVLFPMLRRGGGSAADGPITVMRMEHDQHGEALRRLHELTGGFTLPREACNTWRALYLGLRVLHDDLMEHIHLENNILFEGAPATRMLHA